jgi:hypothetical protein
MPICHNCTTKRNLKTGFQSWHRLVVPVLVPPPPPVVAAVVVAAVVVVVALLRCCFDLALGHSHQNFQKDPLTIALPVLPVGHVLAGLKRTLVIVVALVVRSVAP